jgi:hypothetical protein
MNLIVEKNAACVIKDSNLEKNLNILSEQPLPDNLFNRLQFLENSYKKILQRLARLES